MKLYHVACRLLEVGGMGESLENRLLVGTQKTTNLIKTQSKVCAWAISEGYTHCYLVEEISIQYNIWVTSSELHEREQNTEKKDV